MFAKNVRNAIQEQKADEDIVVYRDIFPGRAIKRGDSTMSLWSLAGQFNSYLRRRRAVLLPVSAAR